MKTKTTSKAKSRQKKVSAAVKKTAKAPAPANDERQKLDVRNYPFAIEWSDADACYVATVPALNGCLDDGPTLEEAARNIGNTAKAWLAFARADNDMPVPEPQVGTPSDLVVLHMSALLRERIATLAAATQQSEEQWMIAALTQAAK